MNLEMSNRTACETAPRKREYRVPHVDVFWPPKSMLGSDLDCKKYILYRYIYM